MTPRTWRAALRPAGANCRDCLPGHQLPVRFLREAIKFTRGGGLLRRRNRKAPRGFEVFQREGEVTLRALRAAGSERRTPYRITLGKRGRTYDQ